MSQVDSKEMDDPKPPIDPTRWWRMVKVDSPPWNQPAFSHLQMDGWKTTIVSSWDGATWQVRTVSIREGTVIMLKEATFSGEMMVPWWLFLPNASNVGFFGIMECMTCNITEITHHLQHQ